MENVAKISLLGGYSVRKDQKLVQGVCHLLVSLCIYFCAVVIAGAQAFVFLEFLHGYKEDAVLLHGTSKRVVPRVGEFFSWVRYFNMMD